MPLPPSLDHWSAQTVEQLLEYGSLEDGEFDFKEMLPDQRNNTEKDRLTTVCASFANSKGGFLIFGISDDKSLPPKSRIIGVDPTLDFMLLFDTYPKKCIPSIPSTPHKRLPLENGKVLYVVHIPASPDKVHCVGKAEEGLRFPIRRDGGSTSFLGHEDLRARFLNAQSRTSLLPQLVAELESIRQQATILPFLHMPNRNVGAAGEQGQVPVPQEISLDIVNELMRRGGELYADRQTLHDLAQLRREIPVINQHIRHLATTVASIGPYPEPPPSGAKFWESGRWQDQCDNIHQLRTQALSHFTQEVRQVSMTVTATSSRAGMHFQHRLSEKEL